MDLNADNTLDSLEIMAWLTRNEYAICRNFTEFDNEGYEKLILPIFAFLDADNNGEINPRDI